MSIRTYYNSSVLLNTNVGMDVMNNLGAHRCIGAVIDLVVQAVAEPDPCEKNRLEGFRVRARSLQDFPITSSD